MLKVRNLGNDICTITAGVIKRGDIAEVMPWEIKLLIRLGVKLEIIMDD